MSYAANYCEFERDRLDEAQRWSADCHKKLGAAIRLNWFHTNKQGMHILERALAKLEEGVRKCQLSCSFPSILLWQPWQFSQLLLHAGPRKSQSEQQPTREEERRPLS